MTTITLSLSEIDALCRKAARGAGYSWGLAEEAGRAARWLSAFGLPGPEALAELMKQVGDDWQSYTPTPCPQGWGREGAPICGLQAGVLLSDREYQVAAGQTIALQQVLQPLLLLPHAGRMAESQHGLVELIFPDVTLLFSPAGIHIQEPIVRIGIANAVQCRLGSVEASGGQLLRPSPQGRAIDVEALEILQQLAAKTYVPATEQSRLAGAGAGLSDND